MRLHSNVLTAADVYVATMGLRGVYATVTAHGSRSHKLALEVRLEGNGYARNSGNYGADSYETGATWDEWGAVMGALYEVDPAALWGSVKRPTYRDADHFHALYADRFKGGTLPADTHKRHVWEWVRGAATCKRCSATQNPALAA